MRRQLVLWSGRETFAEVRRMQKNCFGGNCAEHFLKQNSVANRRLVRTSLIF